MAHSPAGALAYREKNRAKIKAYMIKWRQANPNFIRSKCANNVEFYLRRILYNVTERSLRDPARRRSITLAEVMEMWAAQRGRCAVSNVKMTHDPAPEYYNTNVSIDRIDNAGGYSLENIRLVCRRLNAMRSNMTDADFLYWCIKVARGLK